MFFRNQLYRVYGYYEGAVEKRWSVPVEAEFGKVMKAGKKPLDLQAQVLLDVVTLDFSPDLQLRGN